MTKENQCLQKAVIILGMHRSGTSALARLVNLLGAELGTSFLQPNPANPTGYWEHLQIYDTHEHMLNSMGRVWHSIFPFPEGWWFTPDILSYQQRLIDIIRNDFVSSELWGLKDPRLCRLMPLWHSVLSEVGCKPYFVYVIRNPMEVAESLRRRDGFSWDKCLILWLLHVLESERECRGYPRVFVTYDQLLEDWRATARRISEGLGLEWPKSTSDVEGEVSAFLNTDLRHHHRMTAFTTDGSILTELAAEAYQELWDTANGKESLSTETMAGIETRLAKEIAVLSEPLLMEELQYLSLRVSEIQGLLCDREHEVADLKERVAEQAAQMTKILQSRSWKLTAPLRKGHDLIFGRG